MAAAKSRRDFADTFEGKDMKRKLQQMVASALFNTTSTYSANTGLYPDNLIPFVDKHMNYLVNNPNLESSKYLANIRLITRLR